MIDLHVHSNISDGTLTPSELVDQAVTQNLKAMALTDHDTVGGIHEALQRAAFYQNQNIDFTLIPGVELSVGYKKKEIHILGLYINYQSTELIDLLNKMVQEREERNIKLIENFQNAGFEITYDEIQAESKDAVITRAHFAKLFVRKGYVATPKEAFAKYLNNDSPYYVNRQYITPEQVIDVILNANGIPILAHPMLYNLTKEELEQLTGHLTRHGLQGIETIYSTYSQEEENEVRRLAKQFHLYMTGGSDFHGEAKPDISLGIGKGHLSVPDELLMQFQR